ncbi:RsmB/NOP family class I SAM-dependent RNA methyltransferase [Candidatus Aciduliprofundum boonei]|uniref:RNA methylase, NOL1/NOP2/sun family n=1 Tax=Aciduliprofundum boonei (strain DSM 19572 / T469) TaxID=439481 RepID=B5IFJ2_ACIB4|nr:RsmB/NOP family class I SAM-dependent RNA methyltransferase [Candidatus Aciduliprofundum boonei]ADD08917.1 RNA methylase, NOL1/NOP2/sun family [Aciduliprofundum boonei T469]EDY34947.1 NOL1/NOP2/sun family, putative [Aciduliprofundum boonei T469]HII54768.1 RsmB/NOP family class I SAM-dependent RNA methyltransferase [Candidatus Aciduliprofundum boonei]
MDEQKIEYFMQYSEIIPNFDAFMESLDKPQPYWMRVNTLKIREEELIERLENKGFKLEKYKNLNAYRIIDMPVKHPGATIEHSLGYYYIQDLSSMAPVLALNPQRGEKILDMAAAPGSKTTMLAELMREGTIVANDINFNRLKSLGGNLERLGITNVLITKKDAKKGNFGIKFNKILLDAPCSGEGTVRKNPWGFRVVGDREHKMLARNQKIMLKNASRHVNNGGIIVYSTCTFNPWENEGVVKYGIETLSLEPVYFDIPIPHFKGVEEWGGEKYEYGEYYKRIYPHLEDTGGMFIAVLKK